MIAPVPPSAPQPDPVIIDTIVDEGDVIEFRTDLRAQPGDVVPSLAALVIDLDKRRRQRQAGAAVQSGGQQ